MTMSILPQFLCTFIFLFIQEKTASDQNAQLKMVSIFFLISLISVSSYRNGGSFFFYQIIGHYIF